MTDLPLGKALLVGDIHVSDKPPSACTDTYNEDLLDLLAQTVNIVLDDRSIEAVVWAGDVFHSKVPSRTSHATMQRLILVGQAYLGCEVKWLIVPGNHDLAHDRLDSIEKQPLGVLYKAGAERLDGPWDTENGSLSLFGIPWLQDWGPSLDFCMETWGSFAAYSQSSLMVAHAPIYPPGDVPPYDAINAEWWANKMHQQLPDIPLWDVFYGHVHDTHGVYEVPAGNGKVRFCNNGALTRGSLHESDLNRRVAVTKWGATTGFERVELNYRPASEVFRIVERDEEVQAQERLEEFLNRIGQTDLDVLSIEAVIAQVHQMDIKPETKRLVQELLANAAA